MNNSVVTAEVAAFLQLWPQKTLHMKFPIGSAFYCPFPQWYFNWPVHASVFSVDFKTSILWIRSVMYFSGNVQGRTLNPLKVQTTSWLVDLPLWLSGNVVYCKYNKSCTPSIEEEKLIFQQCLSHILRWGPLPLANYSAFYLLSRIYRFY